jgi:hypothetical protein
MNSTSTKRHPIRLDLQLIIVINLHPPAIEQIPVLRAIKEVLRRKDDGRVGFGIKRDLGMLVLKVIRIRERERNLQEYLPPSQNDACPS